MNKHNLVLSLAAALTLPAGACHSRPQDDDTPTVQIDITRYNVPVVEDDIVLGGDRPLVTLVVYSDYACGPCGKVWRVMKNLHEDYGDDLRIIYRSYTVTGFAHGEQAAEAAFAAHAQDKFWDLHWRLFEFPDDFSIPALRGHATELGLDVPRFVDEIETGVHAGQRVRHRRTAEALGIRALPVVFMNGIVLIGPPHDEKVWHGLVDEEIARVKALMRDGTKRDQVYAALMATSKPGPVGQTQEEKELREKRLAAKADAVAADATKTPATEGKQYAVSAVDAPSKGPADAPVVVVEFTDFQCPFCKKARPVMAGLQEKYGDQVRWTVKHMPLEIHRAAPGAAKASVAAGLQGKFWEFHAKLFEAKGLHYEAFVQIATDLGMDVEKFKADFADPKVAAVVNADVDLAGRLGVAATPAFFVNGYYVEGIKGQGVYEELIDAELRKAAQEEAAGTPKADIHAALMKEAIPAEKFPNARTPAPKGP